MPSIDEIYNKVLTEKDDKWLEKLSFKEMSLAFNIRGALRSIGDLESVGRIQITDEQKKAVALSYAKDPAKYIAQGINTGITPYLEDAGVKDSSRPPRFKF